MVISSRENKLIKQYHKCKSQKKFRDIWGLFCLEGVRLVCDALKSGAQLECIFVTHSCFEKYADAFCEASLQESQVTFITNELAAWLSDVPSPQGVFALAKKLDKPQQAVTIKEGNNYLVLCSLQDPGNLGTVFRTADALGIDHVFLFRSCDIYHPKVVRSTMGALFHLSFSLCESMEPLWEQFSSASVPTVATVVSPSATPIFSLSGNQQGGALLIGNEGSGLSQELIDRCDRQVTIPMPGCAESLNAAIAASICMWELVREKVQKGDFGE